MVILTGNLTRDPEMRTTPSGTVITSMTVCSDRVVKSDGGERKEQIFVDIEAWGKLGETCSKYLLKGRPVLITGRLKFESWEKDNKRYSRLKVVAESVKFLPSGKERKEMAPDEVPPEPKAEKKPVVDEDVPF